MSFDRLAPHYRWMEWLLAGRKLQRCRTAFLGELPRVEHALLLGEGNGRFLGEFLKAQSQARVTCLDASGRMLTAARRRAASARVEFICCNVLDWVAPARQFDLVVSNFFLDCFRPDQLAAITRNIARSTRSDALWLIADFSEPLAGWRKWRARAILWSMYRFFRWTTRLPARTLTAPDAFLDQNGFRLCARRPSEWGLLRSDLWMRSGGVSGRHSFRAAREMQQLQNLAAEPQEFGAVALPGAR
jgi:ubiquinone/menaquinone biosynthesis C-methylase UbiE